MNMRIPTLATYKPGIKPGFTIVELLIVIVVIGILAGLVITTFAGTQAKARDTRRKHDVAEIKKAIAGYAITEGDEIYTGSGCGSAGNGSGFYNYVSAPSYPKSIAQCLNEAGYISLKVIDPSGKASCNGLTCSAYMKYTCASGTYVYAHLETLPQTTTDTDTTCSTTLDTSYGMNYWEKV